MEVRPYLEYIQLYGFSIFLMSSLLVVKEDVVSRINWIEIYGLEMCKFRNFTAAETSSTPRIGTDYDAIDWFPEGMHASRQR